MKKIGKEIAGVAVTICLTVLLLGYMTDLMERKASDVKYMDFFDQKEDFDVLFMGTSHVINAVFPMELWNDYGIISYNCGGHSNQMATTYWTMENALEQTTPKVVVIDCMAISGNWKCSDIFSYLHQSLDAFPLNATKIRAVWDLLDDPALEADMAAGRTRQSDEPRTKIGLLWDYSVYHSRWNELSQNDFEPERLYEKGAESRIRVTRGTFNRIASDQKMEGGTVGEKYLRMMIEDCQNRGIEVLLTYLPFPAGEAQQREANYITDLAKEYGVHYINFLDLDLIDWQTDLFDESSHLNPSGARKVTDYIGKYLVENYHVTDQRNNEAYAEWYTDYQDYSSMKDSQLTAQADIVSYLMLLANDNVDMILDVRNKDIYRNAWIMELLKNVGVDAAQLDENTDFIIKTEKMGQAVCLDHFRENGNGMDTEAGRIQYACDDSGAYNLTVDGNERLSGNIQDDTGMQIGVWRNGVLVDDVRFVYTVNAETTVVNLSAVNR